MAGQLLRACVVCLSAFFWAVSHASTPLVNISVAPVVHVFTPGGVYEFEIEVGGFGGSASFGSAPFGLQGTNAGDFEILSTTCADETLEIGQTCTVEVRYNGNGEVETDNWLLGTCNSVAAGLIGGTISCSGEPGLLAILFAQIAAVAIPLMTPLGTTLLALLMLGFFFFHAVRRTR